MYSLSDILVIGTGTIIIIGLVSLWIWFLIMVKRDLFGQDYTPSADPFKELRETIATNAKWQKESIMDLSRDEYEHLESYGWVSDQRRERSYIVAKALTTIIKVRIPDEYL